MHSLGKRVDTTRGGTLQTQLVRLMQCKEPAVTLDASGVEFASSAGLLMLAACREALEKTGTELHIVNPSEAFILAAARQGLDAALTPQRGNSQQSKDCP